MCFGANSTINTSKTGAPMTPGSNDAIVQVDNKREVQVEEQTPGALPKTGTIRP